MKRFSNGSVNASLAILAIGTGLILSMRPWHVYRNQKADAAKQVTDMRSAEEARAELLREEARAKSTIGREEMARGLGYYKKGQQPADRS